MNAEAREIYLALQIKFVDEVINMPLDFEVNVPKQNTIKYEVVEDGVWAYIKEIPTTRVFGKTQDDACLHLMMLIMNVEDKKGDSRDKP